MGVCCFCRKGTRLGQLRETCTQRKDETLHFIDYVTLQMMSVLVVITGLFFRWGNPRFCLLTSSLAMRRQEAWGFFLPGLLLTILGLHMVLVWPLVSSPLSAGEGYAGNANIVIGCPSLFFGVLFLSVWLTLLTSQGEARFVLMPLGHVASIGGVMLLVLGIAIFHSHVGEPPASDTPLIRSIFNSWTWALVYGCLGLAACISPLALVHLRWLARGRWLLLVPGVILFIALVLTLIAHVEQFTVIAA